MAVAALTAASAGRPCRGPRPWPVTAACAVTGAGGPDALSGGGSRTWWAVPVWSSGLIASSAAASLPVRFVPTGSSDPVESTIGSFVVVLAGLSTAVAVVVTGALGR